MRLLVLRLPSLSRLGSCLLKLVQPTHDHPAQSRPRPLSNPTTMLVALAPLPLTRQQLTPPLHQGRFPLQSSRYTPPTSLPVPPLTLPSSLLPTSRSTSSCTRLGKLFGNKEMRILMLGLDAAGKTSTSALSPSQCRDESGRRGRGRSRGDVLTLSLPAQRSCTSSSSTRA